MKLFLIFLTTAVCLLGDRLVTDAAVAANELVCGDGTWMVYKDEKCVKLIDKLVTHDQARQLCDELQGWTSSDTNNNNMDSLITIKSEDEQNYLIKLIFQDSQVVDNIWLGAVRSSTNPFEFQWMTGGSTLDYTNWAESSPSGDLEKNCSIITSGLYKNGQGTSLRSEKSVNGLWTDASCLKRNLVLCQKPQTWSILELQWSFITLRNELEKKSVELEAVRQQQSELESSFSSLKQNPVPIGFLYTQLPGHSEPDVIWPQVQWTDVSASHAGNFFRVVGGKADAFGKTQSSATSGLLEAHTKYYIWPQGNYPGGHFEEKQNVVISKEPTGASSWRTWRFFTGSWVDSEREMYLDFLVSSEETRPINQAVRIWKRTA